MKTGVLPDSVHSVINLRSIYENCLVILGTLLHPQLLQPIPQGPKTDPQPLRCSRLVPPRSFESFLNSLSLNALKIPFKINLSLGYRDCPQAAVIRREVR